ncbi:hypothetical protein DMC01_10280 [Campylobacter troglodytis]|nr:hypothetical protein DMC01_10280 [Campylobacter troglodytis]
MGVKLTRKRLCFYFVKHLETANKRGFAKFRLAKFKSTKKKILSLIYKNKIKTKILGQNYWRLILLAKIL